MTDQEEQELRLKLHKEKDYLAGIKNIGFEVIASLIEHKQDYIEQMVFAEFESINLYLAIDWRKPLTVKLSGNSYKELDETIDISSEYLSHFTDGDPDDWIKEMQETKVALRDLADKIESIQATVKT